MRYCLVILLALVNLTSYAQRSPFNGLPVARPDSTGAYKILFGGHFHGSSEGRSGYPASTVLAGLYRINAIHANAFLSTGDLFLAADKDSARYDASFFSKLNVPLFNAPGNHDVEGTTYLRSYGPTHQVIDIGVDRVIILDTERDNGDLRGDQLRILQEQADTATGFHGHHLFIVSHRPVWAEDDTRYGPLFKGNTRSVLGSNYRKEVLPLVEQLAQRTEVFWISGSMAGAAPASIFFQRHAPGITYIQSAVRDVTTDALLLAEVSGAQVRWTSVPLAEQEMKSPEDYNADFWEAQKGRPEEFNWRLLPYLVKKIVLQPAFGYGAIVALLLIWLLRRLINR